MRYTQQKAFTMIELIFVIVIIGILAAVAMPKLAQNKDNATGSMCTYEVEQLIHEISNAYLVSGYRKFVDLSITDISNVKINVVNGQGIVEAPDTKVHATGVTYKCDGEALIFLVGKYDITNDYQLSITDLIPTHPAAVKSAKQLRIVHGISIGGTRVFGL